MNRTATALIALTITALAAPAMRIHGTSTAPTLVLALEAPEQPALRIDTAFQPADGPATFSTATEAPLEASVVVVGGTQQQAAVVDSAIERFKSAGLVLPQVTVHLHASRSQCLGSKACSTSTARAAASTSATRSQ